MEEVLLMVSMGVQYDTRKQATKKAAFLSKAVDQHATTKPNQTSSDTDDSADETVTESATESNNDSLSTLQQFETREPDQCVQQHRRRHASNTNGRRVSFNKVQVREYEQVLSFNPACSDGAAVEIGWFYHSEEHLSVDEFELERPPSLPREFLTLSREDRKTILEKQGYDDFDLAAADREIRYVQMHRMKTIRKVIKEEQKRERRERVKARGFPFFRRRRQAGKQVEPLVET